MRPRLLRPDNVTLPTRTPWGGREIVRIKRGLELGSVADLPRIGESWEISVIPEFPSRFADDGRQLRHAIAAEPVRWLGHEIAERYGGQTPLLVKLLDAADHLSVQVHPHTDDPALEPDQSGKPESWYILAARPGAGLYLGFRDGVDRRDVESCLHSAGPLEQLLNFVPVTPGDSFLIRAGTVHAIGAGVTLIEPQFVTPGRRGTTYRYWDWNRRFDESGRLSPTGRTRSLDVERSLAVTRWDAPRGDLAVDKCRSQPTRLKDGPMTRTLVLSWQYFTLERWTGRGTLTVDMPGTMLALVCVRGAATVHNDAGMTTISRGQSAVVPAATGTLAVESIRHPLDGDDDIEIFATCSSLIT